MTKFARRFFLLALILFATASPSRAEDKGTITGKVADKRTGHAIPFANVTLVGVPRGGLTDSEGQFSISGIPPGTYEVKVQFLGYKAESRPGDVVAVGKPTVLEFKLEDVGVHEEKVVEVTPQRPPAEATPGPTR